jgi:hypothetical protein
MKFPENPASESCAVQSGRPDEWPDMKPTIAFRNSLAPAPKNVVCPNTWVQPCKTETLKRQKHGKTSEISMPEQKTFFIIR